MKVALSSPPVLAMYDPNRECKVSADTSSFGLGGILLQKWEEEWRPVAYVSRSLTQTEQRYAQVEKEALAMTWACEKFRNFLIGTPFQLETDHKPLLSLLGSQTLDALPPRIQRFRMRLMRYFLLYLSCTRQVHVDSRYAVACSCEEGRDTRRKIVL